MRALVLGLLIAGISAASAEACRTASPLGPPEAQAWARREPLQAPPPGTTASDPAGDVQYTDIDCFGGRDRERFLSWLPDLGEPVGYKAGLTSRAAQTRFGATAPLLGKLFSSMLLPDGSAVGIDYGARPVWEADLLLVVGDARINDAGSRDEALAALRGYRPFIELPDLIYAQGWKITAERLAYINVGARLGVAGEERPLPADALSSLADMRVRAFDGSGALLAEGKGSDALGHPLDVVLWVRDAVHREGGRLKPGDVISVGAFTPLTPPKTGQTIRVRYEGLAGDPEVSVSFR